MTARGEGDEQAIEEWVGHADLPSSGIANA
jgi:hypothetical protein